MTRDPRLRDKWWRMTHLYKIKTKEGKLVTFKPNETQIKHLAERENSLRLRILKYRQGGFTTLYCIDYLDDALWNPGFSAAIIAHKKETLLEIFYIIKRAYENLPNAIKPTTKQDTKTSYKFDTTFDGQPLDSGIYVSMGLRGGTVQALHVTERAHIEGKASQELEAGSKQAVPLTGRLTEETTANGMNEFYDAFMESWDNKEPKTLDTRAFFYAWHEHLEYSLPGNIEKYDERMSALKKLVRDSYHKELTDGQLLWYFWKEKDIATNRDDFDGLRPEQVMRQENPSTILEAFQSGLGNVFDLVKLDAYQPKEPIFITTNGIKIWKKPDKNGEYVLGADPSEGGSLDKTAISVWERKSKEQVAQWVGMISADNAAELAVLLCNLYFGAYAGIENNIQSMILFFSKLYDNYYSTMVNDERNQRRTKKIGWNTNTKTRDPLIDNFIKEFESGGIIINSAYTLKEMKTFVKKENGRREHASGKHDDALFADMIAVRMFPHYHAREKTTGGGGIKIKSTVNPLHPNPQIVKLNEDNSFQAPDFWEAMKNKRRKKGTIE